MHQMELLGDVGHVESCSVHLEMVLVLLEDQCLVCAKSTIGSDIIWAHQMDILGDVGHVESRLVYLEMLLVLVEDRCMVLRQTYHRHRSHLGRTRWYS